MYQFLLLHSYIRIHIRILKLLTHYEQLLRGKRKRKKGVEGNLIKLIKFMTTEFHIQKQYQVISLKHYIPQEGLRYYVQVH